jgi:hypothetical protein
MKPLIAVLLIAGALSGAPAAQQTFAGVIIDDTCADGGHAQMRMGPTDPECTRLCVMFHDDALVLLDGKDIYALSDQNAAHEFAGRRVTVTGRLDPKTKTIQVEAIRAR